MAKRQPKIVKIIADVSFGRVKLDELEPAEYQSIKRETLKFVNDRIRRLEQAGLADEDVLTSGVRKIAAREVTSVTDLEQAIKSARQLYFNKVSTPGAAHAAMREAASKTGGDITSFVWQIELQERPVWKLDPKTHQPILDEHGEKIPVLDRFNRQVTTPVMVEVFKPRASGLPSAKDFWAGFDEFRKFMSANITDNSDRIVREWYRRRRDQSKPGKTLPLKSIMAQEVANRIGRSSRSAYNEPIESVIMRNFSPRTADGANKMMEEIEYYGHWGSDGYFYVRDQKLR